jgi:hypothetical protein
LAFASYLFAKDKNLCYNSYQLQIKLQYVLGDPKMKILTNFNLNALIFIIFFILSVNSALSEEAAALEVADAAVCVNVVDRQCMDANTIFPAGVGKLYCLTRINGAKGPTQVTHVWYFGQTERARITMEIHSASWRTFSSKIIQSHEIGDWHIDVLGSEGEFLKTIQFEVVP